MQSDIWYDDGNIILQTQKNQLKVYCGILEKASSVFRNMLSLPQPLSTAEIGSIDEHPIVHLSDSSEAMKHILRAILRRECVVRCGLSQFSHK